MTLLEIAPALRQQPGARHGGISSMQDQPNGLCQCGCGQRTTVTRWSDASHGRVAGVPLRYVNGHQNRSRVEDLYREDPATGCWVWRGTLSQGYGTITLEGQRHLAHRLVYERLRGGLATDLDHLCRNRACVNPDHLEPCSRGENVRRGDVAILDWDTVADIREAAMYIEGSQREQARQIAARYPVAENTIRQVLRGRRWPESERPGKAA